MPTIQFIVPGIPQPGGSKKAFVHPKTKRVVVLDDAKYNAAWRAQVALFASQAMAGRELFTGPLQVRMKFQLPRPKCHYRTGKHSEELRPDAPVWHITTPDVIKLGRSTEDALSGIVWRDDCLNAFLMLEKFYGKVPGAQITIRSLSSKEPE